jgi:hypothetical protein
MPDEQPLTGGNVSVGVVRVGDTVRRPSGPWTPAVHALLRYLGSAGFDGAPEPLGIDAQGREVLPGARDRRPHWDDAHHRPGARRDGDHGPRRGGRSTDK